MSVAEDPWDPLSNQERKDGYVALLTLRRALEERSRLRSSLYELSSLVLDYWQNPTDGAELAIRLRICELTGMEGEEVSTHDAEVL